MSFGIDAKGPLKWKSAINEFLLFEEVVDIITKSRYKEIIVLTIFSLKEWLTLTQEVINF